MSRWNDTGSLGAVHTEGGASGSDAGERTVTAWSDRQSGSQTPLPQDAGPRPVMNVHIILDDPAPPSGEATIAGHGPARHFVGWLDLLRVLAELFGEQSDGDRADL